MFRLKEPSTYLTLQGQTQHSEAAGLQISQSYSRFPNPLLLTCLLYPPLLIVQLLISVSEQSQMFSFTVSSARLKGVHPCAVNQTECLVCVITGETQAHQGVAHMV